LNAVVERFGDVYGGFVWDVVVCVGDYGYIFLYIVGIFLYNYQNIWLLNIISISNKYI